MDVAGSKWTVDQINRKLDLIATQIVQKQDKFLIICKNLELLV